MRLTTCPPQPALEQLVLRQLPDDQAGALKQHILECAGCLERIRALAPGLDTQSGAPRNETRNDAARPGLAIEEWIKQVGARRPASDEEAATLSPGQAPRCDINPGLTAFLAPPTERGDLGWLGGYRILEVLGRGGMGVVFRAEDTRLKRTVALKVMLPTLTGDANLGKRFLREAQAMAAVEHDHIVRIYQVGEDRGVPFLAMEFLKGEPLSERLKRDRQLPVPEVLRIGQEIAQGLAAAHATGLIHRDIKPANIWLEQRTPPRVKVLDFGLARAAGQDTHLTRQGAIVGTPGYMAPEQAQCASVDHRADLFSLGAVLYQLCCGKQAFQGPDMVSTLMMVAMHQPQPPGKLNTKVPEALSDLVMRLLEKDPARRPASASEVAAALGAQQGELVRNKAPASQKTEVIPSTESDTIAQISRVHVAPGPKRRRWPWLVAWLALLGLVAAAAALVTIRTPQGDYVLETDDPDFAFQVNNGQVTLEDRKTNRKYNLKAVPKDKAKGEYELEVSEADGLTFKTKTLTIKRGETVALKAWVERKTEPAAVPLAAKIDGAWLKHVATLPAEDQVRAVTAKLQALNPKYDGIMGSAMEAGAVTSLTLCTDNVTDISPLRALTSLAILKLEGSGPGKGRLADLSPLRGLKLAVLAIDLTAVSDLSPLKGMPLTTLNCQTTKVSDLSPLSGMKLTSLDLFSTPVRDLSPLSGMPLSVLNCGSTTVESLSPLKGMPLTELYCFSNKVSDLTPLKDMQLTVLVIEDCRVSSLAPIAGMPLRRLSIYGTGVSDLGPLKGMRLTELNCAQSQVIDLAPLKGMPLNVLFCDRNAISDLSPLKGLPLRELRCHSTKVADLSPLEGMTLTHLDLYDTPVANVAPIKGMALAYLNVGATSVADLSPLKGMPLKELYCFNSKVSDISALQNMKLVRLNCSGAQVTDLSPLRGMPLESLICDFRPERDAQILRSITTLQKINDKPAKEFWKDVYEK
jgi:serine/threonine protein kinase/Leucine-rich repeat (LRR) protein